MLVLYEPSESAVSMQGQVWCMQNSFCVEELSNPRTDLQYNALRMAFCSPSLS